MKSTAEHDELRELLPAAALGALDQVDKERVMAHAEACPECAEELAEYRLVTSELSLMLPHRAMDPARSASLRARLLARARTDLPGRRRQSPLLTVPWLGWTVAAGLAGVLLMHHAVHRPVAYGWLVAGVLAVILVGVGVYARGLHARVRSLQSQLPGEEPSREPN